MSSLERKRASQKRTRAKRKAEGKDLAYQRQRRNSPAGYVDRFIERARRRTPDSDLTREFFEDKMESCAFTGMPFTYEDTVARYHNPTCPSIDRIDSKEGYYTWNTQVILGCLNRMKSDMSQEDFEKLWKELTE